jgi:hypothetical protein
LNSGASELPSVCRRTSVANHIGIVTRSVSTADGFFSKDIIIVGFQKVVGGCHPIKAVGVVKMAIYY